LVNRPQIGNFVFTDFASQVRAANEWNRRSMFHSWSTTLHV
jgi:hypothetical protein